MKHALISIPGRLTVTLPVISTNSHGVTVRTGPNDSPAEEWVPFTSKLGASATILDNDNAN